MSFALGGYDRAKPLIIDPVLSWGGYIGGVSADTGQTIAVDSQGDAYIAGQTQSLTGFPVVNAFQGAHGGGGSIVTDAFVTKINAAGTAIAYSTYLGGNSLDTPERSLSTRPAKPSLPATRTRPTSRPPIRFAQLCPGSVDAFLVKLSAAGNTCCTAAISAAPGRNPPKASRSTEPARCTSRDSLHQPICRISSRPGVERRHGWLCDEVVFHRPASSFQHLCRWIVARLHARDGCGPNQNIYVTGRTTSTNLPQAGGFQAGNAGKDDAFVCKLNSAGARVYWTYIGGAETDSGRSIAVDGAGAALCRWRYEFVKLSCHHRRLSNRLWRQSRCVCREVEPDRRTLDYSTILADPAPDFGFGIAINPDRARLYNGTDHFREFPHRQLRQTF